MYRKPSVRIIVTGNELVDPSGDLEPGKIPNSNRYTLKALVESAGGVPDVLHCGDDLEGVKDEIRRAADEYDAVITTGGTAISKGDVVVDAVKDLGRCSFMELRCALENPWHSGW